MGLEDILNEISITALTETDFSITLIAVFMSIALALSLYIFLIYRLASRRGFYSSAFAKTLVGMTVITTSIIIAMQGSLIVSLGMVGALSIVRFRNAVKDPMDLLFLFWSISSGIVCGTGLFNIAIITSIIMTIVILGLDYVPFGQSTYILTIGGDERLSSEDIMNNLKKSCKQIKIRNRSLYNGQKEYLIEFHTKNEEEVVESCNKLTGVQSVSLIAHDGEVRF